MVKSILDSDLYKFTQQFAVLTNKELSNLRVRYEFFNRNDIKFPEGFDLELKRRVQSMSELYLKKDEKKFFQEKCGKFLPSWYFDFLESYRFDPNEVFIFMENGNLKIKIENFWYKSILWEVPLMAIISELYFEMTKQYIFNNSENRNKRFENNTRKAKLMVMNNLKVSDFSTRRRYSYENQKEMLQDLISYSKGSLVGTSNVHFAHIFNINCHGTQSHEWFMVHSALYGYISANIKGLENWINTYNGDLGTALTDTFTSEIFFQSFNLKYSHLFTGCRHDSGSPYEYIDKVVAHYRALNIDISTKTIIFSDGLNIEEAIKIMDYCNKIGIRCAFGVGTNLSNDLGIKPLNMVIKVTQVYYQNKWIDVVKLSDNLGKHTGKMEEIILCKQVLRIPDIVYDKQPAGNEDDVAHINIVN